MHLKTQNKRDDFLIRFDGVDVELSGNSVLENISMEIFPGEIVTLIGLNGAGKTTLLKTILGIYKIKKGKIDMRAKRIGYVPQKLQFDRTIPFSVREFLDTYSGRAAGKIEDVLKEVKADGLIDKKIGNLSGGELQKVLIANALLQKPDLLLLDEATAGVDIKGEQNFFELIAQIHEKYQVTIVMVLHDIHTVFSKASKVFCLNKTICCHGKPKDVSQSPEFTKLFGPYLVPYEHHNH